MAQPATFGESPLTAGLPACPLPALEPPLAAVVPPWFPAPATAPDVPAAPAGRSPPSPAGEAPEPPAAPADASLPLLHALPKSSTDNSPAPCPNALRRIPTKCHGPPGLPIPPCGMQYETC